MVVVDCDGTLDVDDLPVELESVVPKAPLSASEMQVGLSALVGRPLEDVEQIFISETLKLTGGNREQAAEMLGIGERTLYRKIKEFQRSGQHSAE